MTSKYPEYDENKSFQKYLKEAKLIQLWGNPTPEVESGNIGIYDIKVIESLLSQAYTQGKEDGFLAGYNEYPKRLEKLINQLSKEQGEK